MPTALYNCASWYSYSVLRLLSQPTRPTPMLPNTMAPGAGMTLYVKLPPAVVYPSLGKPFQPGKTPAWLPYTCLAPDTGALNVMLELGQRSHRSCAKSARPAATEYSTPAESAIGLIETVGNIDPSPAAGTTAEASKDALAWSQSVTSMSPPKPSAPMS